MYLGHILEELLATPALETPVVVVLLGAPNAESPVASRAATKELASAQLHLAVVDGGLLFRDDIPIGFKVEEFGPAN